MILRCLLETHLLRICCTLSHALWA